MNCVTAAASLKKLLVAHSTAESQVSVLGKCFVLFFTDYFGAWYIT